MGSKSGVRGAVSETPEAGAGGRGASDLASHGQDHQALKGISMDGGMVNVRGEGWKEIKVGAVFDVE